MTQQRDGRSWRGHVAIVGLLVVWSCVIAAQVAERAQTDALSRRVSDRIRILQDEAARLAGQTRSLLVELRQSEVERDLHIERAAQADAELTKARTALEQTTARLKKLERERVEQLPDISARLVELYKQGRAGYLRMLLSAANMRELGRTTRAVASLAALNDARIAEHRRTLAALQVERQALDDKSVQLQAVQADAERARSAAERAVTARTALITEVDRRRDLTAQLVGELQLAQQKLSETVASLRAGAPADFVSVPVIAFRGVLDWPVVGHVRSRFGRGSRVAADAPGRNGIEIDAPEGTPVHAIHAGTVTYADTFAGYGTLVIVDHGANHLTLYGYLATAHVQRDQHVDAGAELGRVGLAPAGPPGLYFELRADGRAVNPLQWLKPR